jgi:hypothetical protein
MKKKVKVVMLPTEKASSLYITKHLYYTNVPGLIARDRSDHTFT